MPLENRATAADSNSACPYMDKRYPLGSYGVVPTQPLDPIADLDLDRSQSRRKSGNIEPVRDWREGEEQDIREEGKMSLRMELPSWVYPRLALQFPAPAEECSRASLIRESCSSSMPPSPPTYAQVAAATPVQHHSVADP